MGDFNPNHPLKLRPPGARRKSIAEFKKDKLQERAALASPPISHGYAKSFDGLQLFYSVEGTGLPLVFCYGLVCSSLHWTYQIDHFQSSHRAVWFDYRGHHNSELPTNLDSLTLENNGRDIGTILDQLGIEQAVILGHSMGVNSVLEFYRQQPHRVKAMVLANGTAKPPLETMFRNNLLQSGFKILKQLHELSPEAVQFFWKMNKGNPIARSIIALGGFNPHLTPKEDIQLYVDQVAEMDPTVFIRLMEDYDHYDASKWLHEVKVPTLILAGEQDKVVPLEQQELMHQLIPGSRFEVIRHGSHCPQMDLPEQVNGVIEKFLADINYLSASTPTKGTASRSTARRRVRDQAEST